MLSKSYLTILTNLILSVTSAIIAYLTNWMWIIPILFGLGIPLVNIDKPLKQKFGLILVIVIASVGVFFTSILTVISVDFDKFIFPGIVVGIAGLLILGINGLLIESIKMNLQTIGWTFVLAGLSLPCWILLIENEWSSFSSHSDFLRQFGAMIFWMLMTTIGISIGIKREKPTANKKQLQGL